jgi:hypothetical protein
MVEGRPRTLVLTDGPRLWGFSRRFVVCMADPRMVSTVGATAASRNSFGSPTVCEAAYFSSLWQPHHLFSRRGGMLQLKGEATLSAMCSPDAGSSLLVRLEAWQSTPDTQSQRLFVGEYSRRCCGRREESINNGLATHARHAGSHSHTQAQVIRGPRHR